MVRPEALAGVADVDLAGRTILVTGATHGIGRHAALSLSRLGATVLVHGRDREAGESVVDRMGDGAFLRADFTDMDVVRDLADRVEEHVDSLDVLVNNAGAHFRTGALTGDDVERTMAVNHLAPFLLTNRLLPTLSAGARVVTVASRVHRGADLDLEGITSIQGYDGFDAYGRSKLANVLFTRELARRLDEAPCVDGVTANCLHPGFIPGSALWRDSPLPIRGLMAALGLLPAPITRLFAETPASGARTIVYLAASPAVSGVSGRYFVDCEPVEPAAAARDDDLARRLWDESARLVGLDEPPLDREPATGA